MLPLKRSASAAAIFWGILSSAPVQAGTFTTLHNFGGSGDGQLPLGALLYEGGLLYGTTVKGGTSNVGTVYSLDPSTNAETVLHSFKNGPSALKAPDAGALAFLRGSLFGTTFSIGDSNDGGAYRLRVKSDFCHEIASFSDTSGLQGGKLTYWQGLFYGTTISGGTDNGGTLFSLDPTTGALITLYNFGSGAEGANPAIEIVVRKGVLYGATLSQSTVFSFDIATNQLTILAGLGFDNGQQPANGVTLDGEYLYGAAYALNSHEWSIFKVNIKAQTHSIIFRSNGKAGVRQPSTALILANGILYGASTLGGDFSQGTVFQFDLSTKTETVLHSFSGGADGGYPSNADLVYADGTLYGTVGAGGSYDQGILFALTP